MEHLILMKTEFFRLIDNPDSRNGLNAAYNDFTMAVVSLCMGAASPCHPLPALSYAETELQYHKAIQSMDTGHGMYVRKALSFVRKMQRHLSASHIQVPPLHQQSRPDNHHKMARPSTVLRWTGKASDLVEILYGMAEMGCVNDGEIPIGELADIFYSLFNVEAKDCYRIYSDLKLRKNDSRTYFLERKNEAVRNRSGVLSVSPAFFVILQNNQTYHFTNEIRNIG